MTNYYAVNMIVDVYSKMLIDHFYCHFRTLALARLTAQMTREKLYESRTKVLTLTMCVN